MTTLATFDNHKVLINDTSRPTGVINPHLFNIRYDMSDFEKFTPAHLTVFMDEYPQLKHWLHSDALITPV